MDKLLELFYKTSFYDETKIEWSRSRGDEDGFHVPECSYLGGTLICLAGTYEGSDDDCLFIQELIRAFKEGRLKETPSGG